MPAATLPTFAGTTLPSELLAKLDAQAATLDARTAARDARLAVLERGVAPVGGSPYGQVDDASLWNYADPAVPGYGSAALKASLPTIASLDPDGRAAYLWLTPTRLAVVTPSGSTPAGAPLFTSLVFDISATGVPTLYASASHYTSGTASTGMTVQGAWLAAAGGGAFRYLAQVNINSQIGTGDFRTVVVSVTVNADGTLSATVDAAFMTGRGNGSVFPTLSGFGPRRRAYPVGTYSAFIPVRSFNTYELGLVLWGGYSAERQAGGTLVLEGGAQRGASNVHGIDQMAVDTFLRITDGYTANTNFAAGAVVQAVVSDDLAIAAPVRSRRLTNAAIQGNVRVQCLATDGSVVAFTSGGAFASWAIRRDPATGALTVSGSPATNGPMGSVPFDTAAFSASKVLWFVKGAGLSAIAYTVSVDLAAPSGASPFAQVAATPAFNLGTGAASSTPGDSYTPAFAAPMPGRPSRVVFFGRNTTRTANVIDVVDFGA